MGNILVESRNSKYVISTHIPTYVWMDVYEWYVSGKYLVWRITIVRPGHAEMLSGDLDLGFSWLLWLKGDKQNRD